MVTYTITDFAEYYAALTNQTIAEKRLLLTADIAVPAGQSNIYIYGDVVVETKDFDGEPAKITAPATANYMFYLQSAGGVAAKLTLKNVQIIDGTSTNAVTFYLNAAGNTVTMVGCKLEKTNSYRVFSAGSGLFNKVRVSLIDTEVKNGDGSGDTFYRGTFCLYGNTTYTGSVKPASSNDYALLFDYTLVTLGASMGADFKVTLSYDNLPIFKAGTHAAADNVKLYYTIDGTDPLTSSSALLYTEAFLISGVTQVRFTMMDKTSPEKSELNRAYEAYFFDYTVSYTEETISWDTTAIEISRSNDFASILASGAVVTPSETLYARIKGEDNIFEIRIAARPAAPTGVALGARTDVSVTVTANADLEYKLGASGAWQNSSAFTGLTADTSYTVYFRLKATASAFYSQEATLAVRTMGKKAAVSAGDVTINFYQAKIEFDGAVIEVNTNAAFTGASVASGTDITPSMTLYARMKADADNVAGDAYIIVIPARPAVPAELTYTSTKNSVTVTAIEGAEYKLGNGDDAEWQDSNVFVGLSADTEYVIYVRIAVSENAFASEETYVATETKAEDKAPAGGCGCGTVTLGGGTGIMLGMLFFSIVLLIALRMKKSRKQTN